MRQPCEAIVLDILPSLRAQLAKQLVKAGLTQQEVSNKLEITPAAVSQYVSGKRGQKINFSNEIKNKMKKEAKQIIKKEEKQPSDLICIICSEIKDKEKFCELIEEKEKQECDKCEYKPVCVC